ncbi:MAG: right-handed parallel beta-helix repeat-containing protein [Campylobacterota bacterium]|nr:right-handed parallel beta-helix repeat-containing protein [Campylobacterota bacterium]
MKYSKSALMALATVTAITMVGCGGSSDSSATPSASPAPAPVQTDPTIPDDTILSGNYSSDIKLTADKTWILDGLVVIKDGATLTIEAGTTIAGLAGTGDATSYMIIDKDAKIIAEGTESEPIIFTSSAVAVDSEEAAVGQWGGLTIIGNAGNAQVQPYEVNTAFVAGQGQDTDNSGVLKHVKILNSGITMAEDKEINGLSFVGVGSGTVVENITVDNSDDDGVEIWGGTVNLTNVTITNCTDDHFDIDDGYSGTVKNLNITQTSGNAAIEMSGETSATFDGFTITQNVSAKEGGIYFKKDGIGGYFKNGTVTDNNNAGDPAGAIHSKGIADIANISFENVTLNGTSTDARFTGDSADEIETKFDVGTSNNK